MSPSDVIAAGERLYGPNWVRPLAAALDVNETTVRRWTQGTAVRRANALAIQRLLEQKDTYEQDLHQHGDV